MNYSEFIDSLSSSYRNQLSKLTSASSESPPGYLYKELVEYIKTDLSKLNEIEEYIINKLSRKEPFIKIKCLKLLKHLCTNFPKDFIRTKVTQSQSVLECKNYRTPANEYNGDYLSKLVRSEFEELIKVVCSYDSIEKKAESQSDNKMVGFGNNQYTNQSSKYQAPGGFGNPSLSNPNLGYGNPNYANPGYGNPNTKYGNPNYGPGGNRGVGGFGNPGMVGFGNPNMPRTQSNSSNSFSSFASNFTPTVSELKNAGNNALKMITHAANKYIPSEIRDKLEKVGSAITSTATEQFEKYLGGRSPMKRSSSRSLNNSMYNNRGYGGSHPQGFGSTHGHVNYPPGGGSSSYNPASYSAVDFKSQQQYSQSQHNPHQFNPNFTQQGYSAMHQSASATTFTHQPTLSHSGSMTQGFDPFLNQQSFTPSFQKVGSVGSFPSKPEHTVDLLTTEDTSSKYTVPGEREVEFVKEMLTFTGIKVSPSPRLIDEYMEKMKEMDKKIVVDELLKHLNSRSSKWQTHFRILCIFESLFQRGGLDESTVRELNKTAAPIFNKCKEEAQLSNKASKLLGMLPGLTGGVTGEVSDLFGNSNITIDMFSTNTRESASKTLTSSNLLQNKEADPFEGKTEDLFTIKTSGTNPAMVPVGSNMDEFDLFFSNTTSIQESERGSRVKAEERNPQDPFDFDSLSFGNTNQKARHEVRGPQHSTESISSNIDNNLDLFDNTDFNAEILSGRQKSHPPHFQNPKPSPAPETFDLL